MQHIIAANSNCYHGFSIEQSIGGIRRAGFRHIELTATKGWTEHVFPGHSFSRLLAVKSMLAEAELDAVALSGHCNLMDAARIGDFTENIQLAGFFGCRYIVSSVGEAHLADQAAAGDAEVAARIASLLPLLAAQGLTLVLETHGKAHATGRALEAIVRRVGHPRVRINYDTANVIFYGGADPAEDLAACVSDVGYLHLKDKAGAPGEWNFPALGQGSVDFPRLFSVLQAAGNASPMSVEIEFTQAGPANVAEVDEALRQSAAYLSAHGFAL